MAQLVVRNLEAAVKARLQRRARRHGHSMEEEVRVILRNAVPDKEAATAALGSRLRKRFASLGLKAVLATVRRQKPRAAVFKS